MSLIEPKAELSAVIRQQGVVAGHLASLLGGGWQFKYHDSYIGPPVSLTLPVQSSPYGFAEFPAVFEGLLPEGPQLEALLRRHKIDRHDTFRLLVTVGRDLVGSLTVEEASPPHS